MRLGKESLRGMARWMTVAARGEMREWTEAIFGVDVSEVRLTRRGLVDR